MPTSYMQTPDGPFQVRPAASHPLRDVEVCGGSGEALGAGDCVCEQPTMSPKTIKATAAVFMGPSNEPPRATSAPLRFRDPQGRNRAKRPYAEVGVLRGGRCQARAPMRTSDSANVTAQATGSTTVSAMLDDAMLARSAAAYGERREPPRTMRSAPVDVATSTIFGTRSSARGSPAAMGGSSTAHTARQRAANPSRSTTSFVYAI